MNKQAALTERNHAIQLETLITETLHGKIEDAMIQTVIEYMNQRVTFSLGHMSDTFVAIPVGTLKTLIAKIKSKIDDMGYGKKGSNVGATLNQAGRCERYLKEWR